VSHSGASACCSIVEGLSPVRIPVVHRDTGGCGNLI
jgi:hypothetical protein